MRAIIVQCLLSYYLLLQVWCAVVRINVPHWRQGENGTDKNRTENRGFSCKNLPKPTDSKIFETVTTLPNIAAKIPMVSPLAGCWMQVEYYEFTILTKQCLGTVKGGCTVITELSKAVSTEWWHCWLITRAHSFPRQILPNSAALFAKFRGSPRQILGIPRLTAAARFRVYCTDFGPVMPQNVSIIVTSNY